MLQIHWHSKTWFKLRFSGFDDEWKTYKLKDLLHNKSSSISINQLDDNVGNYPLYGASGFLKCIDFYEMDSDYISIVKDGSGVGNISFHEKNTSVVNTSQYILPKENLNIHFIFYLLQTINLNKYKTGSTIPHIYFKDYSIEKVKIPKYDEQKKIGILLKNLDAKIEILDNKLQMCQNFKKYLMQQIFTQKLRFDYDMIKLKDICKINKGKQLNKDAMIENGKYYVLNGGKEPSGYTNEWNTSENTITISEGGNSCGYVNFNTEKFWSGGHCYYLSNLHENVDDYYLYSYLKFKEEFIMRLRVGSGLPNIQKGDIENIKIQIVSKDNQNKISNLLLSADKKINSIQIQKENFENFKKGLLQQMFVVRINWRCNFKLAKSPSFNKHLLILKNKIIFIIIK